MLELLWDELDRIKKDGYSIADIDNLLEICKLTYKMRIITSSQYTDLVNALSVVELHSYIYRSLQ